MRDKNIFIQKDLSPPGLNQKCNFYAIYRARNRIYPDTGRSSSKAKEEDNDGDDDNKKAAAAEATAVVVAVAKKLE